MAPLNSWLKVTEPVGLPLGSIEWGVVLLLINWIGAGTTEAGAGEVEMTVVGAGDAQVVVVAWLLPLPANVPTAGVAVLVAQLEEVE